MNDQKEKQQDSNTPLLADNAQQYYNTSTMNENKPRDDETEEAKHSDDDIPSKSDLKQKRSIPRFSFVEGEMIFILLHIQSDDAFKVSVDGVSQSRHQHLRTLFNKGSYLRIMCESKYELPKTIKISKSFPQKIVKTINYQDIVWSKEETFGQNGNTFQRKFVEFTDFDCILYQERISASQGVHWYRTVEVKPTEYDDHGYIILSSDGDEFKTFANFNWGHTKIDCTAFSKLDVTYYDDDFFFLKNNQFQIYYSEYNNSVFSIPNDVVKESKAFGNVQTFDIDTKQCYDVRNTRIYQDTPMYIDEAMKEDKPGSCYLNARKDYYALRSLPFYEDNITDEIWMYLRYKWLIEHCLYGQDNEFNIFRSLCFTDSHFNIRLALGILCIILQAFLTIGIVMEVINNWDTDNMFDNDIMIIIISFLVFAFISFLYTITVQKYFQFYENMSFIFEISWFIIILDFISNILIGLTICLFSFFYLLESESISDVVLNSFALTFIIELDDLANIYESDEDKLLEADWNMLWNKDYHHETRKRRIMIFGGRHRKRSCITIFCILCSSPLTILYAIWSIIHGITHYIWTKRRYAIKKSI